MSPLATILPPHSLGVARSLKLPSLLIACCALLTVGAPALHAEDLAYNRRADLIYGRKHGMALTLDVLQPKERANGIGIIWVASGGWYSGHAPDGHAGRVRFLLDRGYTVFTVVHGSQPKFAIPEILDDLHRATRFIRFHAKEYGIDPDRIGIAGGSAGGHLSTMQGMAGNEGNPQAKDPIDRVSSRVQAVACYFPPTDFLNYGKPGENAIGRGILDAYAGAFDFREVDPKRRNLVPITDEQKITEIGKRISPVNHVSADDPPTLIIHGDKDRLVPIQQAELLIEKLKAAGVPAKLEVKPGAEHGWPKLSDDDVLLADWFDAHLKRENSR